jgi:hypothetical protein
MSRPPVVAGFLDRTTPNKELNLTYNSQGNHTDQLDFYNWLAVDSKTGLCN